MNSQMCDHLELVIPSQFPSSLDLLRKSSSKSDAEEVRLEKKNNQMMKTGNIGKAETKKQQQKQLKISGKKINTKQGLKKMAQKSLRHQKLIKPKKSEGKKQINLSTINKIELSLQIKESEDKMMKKRGHGTNLPSELLAVRSIELNQQLQQLKTNRSICSSSRKNSKRVNKSPESHFGTSLQQRSIEMSETLFSQDKVFKQIDNYFSVDQSFQKPLTNQKGKCFYDKLKDKLSLEIKKIHLKKQSAPSELIEYGCKSKSRTNQNLLNTFKSPFTDRPRPRTALARTRVQTSRDPILIERKRPMSSRAKILEKKQLDYMNEKIQEQTEKELIRMKIDPPKKKRVKVNYEPDLTKSLRHISPMHKKKNWCPSKPEMQRQKVKEKMLKLLIDCHQAQKIANLGAGIKVFDRYCKSMSKNFDKTCRMIEQAQKTITFKDQSEDLL